MTDEPEDLTLMLLRRLDAKMDRLLEDMHDLKMRATNSEEAIAGVNRRLDRVDARIDRIEKRLDLVEV